MDDLFKQGDEIAAAPIILITCAFCTKEDVQKCLKCQRFFCPTHSCRVSPNFCQDCFKNLSVIIDKFTRTIEDYDHTTDSMVVKKESCTQLRLDGPDYVFYTKWINQLNDDELRSVFEFHYFITKLIEHENETRIIAKNKKKRETPYPISVTKTTETKTTKTTQQKDLRSELRKLKVPEAVIDAMIAAAQTGG